MVSSLQVLWLQNLLPFLIFPCMLHIFPILIPLHLITLITFWEQHLIMQCSPSSFKYSPQTPSVCYSLTVISSSKLIPSVLCGQHSAGQSSPSRWGSTADTRAPGGASPCHCSETHMRSDCLTAMTVTVLWDVTPCSLISEEPAASMAEQQDITVEPLKNPKSPIKYMFLYITCNTYVCVCTI